MSQAALRNALVMAEGLRQASMRLTKAGLPLEEQKAQLVVLKKSYPQGEYIRTPLGLARFVGELHPVAHTDGRLRLLVEMPMPDALRGLARAMREAA